MMDIQQEARRLETRPNDILLSTSHTARGDQIKAQNPFNKKLMQARYKLILQQVIGFLFPIGYLNSSKGRSNTHSWLYLQYLMDFCRKSLLFLQATRWLGMNMEHLQRTDHCCNKRLWRDSEIWRSKSPNNKKTRQEKDQSGLGGFTYFKLF